MWLALASVIFGLLLIFIEFFVPGGILASIGVLSVIFGITILFFASVSLYLKITFFIGACVMTAAVCSFALHLIKRQKKSSLCLSSDQQGFSVLSYGSGLIGLQGTALSDLKPSGHVEIGGERYQALSDRLYLEKGTPVVVVEGGRGACLIVRSAQKEKV